MGLFEHLFKNNSKDSKTLKNYFKLLNGYTPVFTSFEGGMYEMELTRAAIHTFATHCSKLKPEVIGSACPNLKNLLKYKPNPFMDTSKFLYRIATILMVQNTAFIVPILNEIEKIVGYFPVVPSKCEIREDSKGIPWLVFDFANGKKSAVEFERVGVMTRHQYKSDVFGEKNNAIIPTIQLLHTQNQGIIEGIKNSAFIRFMAKAGNMFSDEDLKKKRDNFAKLNLSSENSSGLLIFDGQFSDVKQISSENFVINAAQQKIINDNVFNYTGTNLKLLQNDYDENSWNSFYEGAIEPFAIQLSLVMSNMTYTNNELSHGNEILFSANRLQYASNTTKLNVVTQLFDRGFITINEGLEIFNMPPVKDGDKRIIRGEYMNTDEKVRKDLDE